MSFCNGCTACCKGDTITLQPDEDPEKWETDERDGIHTLKKGVDGSCIYLVDTGCTIYGSQPKMCRVFNCVSYFKLKSRNERRALIRKNPNYFGAIFKAARARM